MTDTLKPCAIQMAIDALTEAKRELGYWHRNSNGPVTDSHARILCAEALTALRAITPAPAPQGAVIPDGWALVRDPVSHNGQICPLINLEYQFGHWAQGQTFSHSYPSGADKYSPSKQAPDPQEPTEEELAAVVKAAWLKVKPSKEAQHIRAEISMLFDTGKGKHTSEADFMPLYVWDIADIAAQTAIEKQAPAAMREGDLEVLKSEACEATGYQYSGTRKAVYATINYLHKRGLLRVGEG